MAALMPIRGRLINFAAFAVAAWVFAIPAGARADSMNDLVNRLSQHAPFPETGARTQCQSQSDWRTPWIEGGFRNPVHTTYSQEEITEPGITDRKVTREFIPTLVVSRSSGWTPQMILHHLRRTNSIFHQCGIRVRAPQIYWVDAMPIGDRIQQSQTLEIARRVPVQNRPLLFFLDVPGTQYDSMEERQTNNTAFALAERSLTRVDATSRGYLLNTAWFGKEIESPDYIRKRSTFGRHFDTVAHEMAHLLCNCGHVDGPETNLLSLSYFSVSEKVTPEQCAAFRASPLVRRH